MCVISHYAYNGVWIFNTPGEKTAFLHSYSVKPNPRDIIGHRWTREREKRGRTERQIYIFDSSGDYNASSWGQSLTTPTCSFPLYLITSEGRNYGIPGWCNLKSFEGLHLIYHKKLQTERKKQQFDRKKEKWPSLLYITVHCIAYNASANILMRICLKILFDD